MFRSKRWLVAGVALFIALGAAPAMAGQGGGDSTPLPEQVLMAELGFTAEEIAYFQSQGLGYPQIYLLHTAATYFGISPLALYQSLDGKVAWGRMMRLFDANFGAFLAAGSH